MGPVHVLLIEDDPGDVALTRALLRESKVALDLSVVEDGEAALRFLRRQEPYDAEKPADLVILDLHLPKLDGFEVMRQVRKDPELQGLRLCVVTVSDLPADQERAKAAGADCFVTKPLDLAQFEKIVRHYEPFWLAIVRSSPRG